jgi:hypothetical protein
MKKTLLAILALGMTSVAFAQDTNCDVSKNLATAGGEGFKYKFMRNDLAGDKEQLNCLPADGGYSDIWGSAFGGNPNVSFAVHETDNKLVMTVPTAVTGQTIPNRFPKGNCFIYNGSDGLFDLSNDYRVHMVIHTTVRTTLALHIAVLQGGYGEPQGTLANPRPSWTLEADTKYEICSNLATQHEPPTGPIVDFLPNFDKPLGFVWTLTTEADNGVISIDSISFGEAAGLVPAGTFNIIASTNDAVLESSLINVYPTPSSDVLNIDLSKLSADAELKLVSSNGETVYTTSASNSLNKINVAGYTAGLYALQITSDGKSTTKKVVIK